MFCYISRSLDKILTEYISKVYYCTRVMDLQKKKQISAF